MASAPSMMDNLMGTAAPAAAPPVVVAQPAPAPPAPSGRRDMLIYATMFTVAVVILALQWQTRHLTQKNKHMQTQIDSIMARYNASSTS